MSDKNFPQGINFYAPRAGAPDFVKGQIVVNPVEFAEFIRTNGQFINDKGQMRIDVKESRGGKMYCEVNTYGLQEKTQEFPPAPPREKTQAEISADEAYAEYGESHGEIPF